MSQASDASAPAIPARTTDGCQPTARTYAKIATSAASCPASRGIPSSHASTSTAPREHDDVLARHGEQVVEPGRLEVSRNSSDSPSSSPSTMPTSSASPLTRLARRRRPARGAPGAGRTGRRDLRGVRSAPVAAAQHDMDAAPSEPGALVEAVLGPARLDQQRAQLEDRALRRRPPERKLQQDALAHTTLAEAAHLRGHAQRELRAAHGPGHDPVARPSVRSRARARSRSSASSRAVPHPQPARTSSDAHTRGSAPGARRRRRPPPARRASRNDRGSGRAREIRQPPARGTRRARAASAGRARSRRHQLSQLLERARARCPESRRDRRPSGTARARRGSRRSSAPSRARRRAARRAARPSPSRGSRGPDAAPSPAAAAPPRRRPAAAPAPGSRRRAAPRG